MTADLIRLVATYGPIVFAAGVVFGYFGHDHNTTTSPGRKRK